MWLYIFFFNDLCRIYPMYVTSQLSQWVTEVGASSYIRRSRIDVLILVDLHRWHTFNSGSVIIVVSRLCGWLYLGDNMPDTPKTKH